MIQNNELFSIKIRQKMTKNAFFSYVAQVTNKNVINILLSDSRFVNNVIDTEKVYFFRLSIKYNKKKIFRKKYKCAITGRHRGNISFFGRISRFQLKEMVCDGQFLIGISRCGW